jgi:hypothetical protein
LAAKISHRATQYCQNPIFLESLPPLYLHWNASMPLYPAQKALIEDIYRYAEIKDTLSMECKQQCAKHSLQVIEQFQSLAAYQAAIHEYNGSTVQQFNTMASDRLLSALSFEHPGLDTLLAAVEMDYHTNQAFFGGSNRKSTAILDSTAPEDLPLILNEQGQVIHDLVMLHILFPNLVEQTFNRAYRLAEDGDQSFFTLMDYTRAIRDGNTLYVSMPKGTKSKISAASSIIEQFDEKCITDHLRLKDPRRIYFLGEEPKAYECYLRLSCLMEEINIGKTLTPAERVELITRYEELVNACPDLTDDLLRIHLFDSSNNVLSNLLNTNKPSTPVLDRTTEDMVVLAEFVAMFKRWGIEVVQVLVSVLQKAETGTLAPDHSTDNPAYRPEMFSHLPEKDRTLAALLRYLPDHSSQERFANPLLYWVGGLIYLANPERLLSIELPDHALFKLYQFFDDVRFRDRITGVAYLETALGYDLGL